MNKPVRSGFTLIELIVVIAILAILSAILIPLISGYLEKSRNTKNETNCNALYKQSAYELLLGKALAIGESDAEPSSATGTMTISYALDSSEIYFESFTCSDGAWSHTEQ